MTVSVLTPVSSAAAVSSATASSAAGPRLRSVRPDESAASPAAAAKPGVYRLPEHVLAGLRLGEQETPLVGYLLLVPAGTTPEAVPAPVPVPAPAPVPAAVPVAAAVPTREPSLSSRSSHGLLVDRELRTAHLDGEQLELTYLEFELLSHLTAHPHRVHSRDRLVEAVWGYYGHVGDGRTVDVHVARLRRKLGPDYRAQIVTVRRVGYKYVPASR